MSKHKDDYIYLYGGEGEPHTPEESVLDDEYIKLYKEDSTDAFVNGAFDDEGDEVLCDCCGGELRYRNFKWVCEDCGESMDRADYFNYIGAEPPFEYCKSCIENYPVCRNWCDLLN